MSTLRGVRCELLASVAALNTTVTFLGSVPGSKLCVVVLVVGLVVELGGAVPGSQPW
jgi:hypothetical protein